MVNTDLCVCQAQLVRNIVKSNGILVTSFNTLVIQQEVLLPYNWHYIVLDEGHKIRNPNAQVTLCCKQVCWPDFCLELDGVYDTCFVMTRSCCSKDYIIFQFRADR